VLRGVDLTGTVALITGASSGLGVETARALAAHGARLVLAVRDVAKGVDALAAAGVASSAYDLRTLDLADLSSVRSFTDGVLADVDRLDLLIANAGVMACPETRVGPGWEAQFATNHLGHFALVNRLWPAVADGARVVSLSSRGHHYSPIRWDDVQFETGYEKWQAYGQAKTANVLFAVQLDRLGAGKDVRAFALHPGGIMTPLQRHLPREEMIERGWIDEAGNYLVQFKTPEQGAATTVWAATSPQLTGLGGLYLEDCDVAELAPEDAEGLAGSGVRRYAVDREQAARLWTLSAQLTGVDAFAGK